MQNMKFFEEKENNINIVIICSLIFKCIPDEFICSEQKCNDFYAAIVLGIKVKIDTNGNKLEKM